MFKKIRTRNAIKKILKEIKSATKLMKDQNDFLNAMGNENTNKIFYIEGSNKVAGLARKIDSLLRKLEILMDKVKNSFGEEQTKAIFDEILTTVSDFCNETGVAKEKLNKLQQQFEPDEKVIENRRKLRLDGGIDIVPETKIKRTEKSPAYVTMLDSVSSLEIEAGLVKSRAKDGYIRVGEEFVAFGTIDDIL